MRSPIVAILPMLLWAGAAQAGVVVNELLPNPTSTDAGNEWIELYNNGTVAEDLSGWTIEAGTSTYALKYTIPSSTSLAPGDWLLIGDELVTGADLNLATSTTLGLGNATNADAVRLKDATGAVVDTVVYGTPNTDLWLDDTGVTATAMAPAPTEAASLARLTDGLDSNASAIDFVKTSAPTPGAANGGGTDTDTGGTTTCTLAALVKINEILPDPASTDEGNEWIELFNDDTVEVDLSGWTLAMGTTSYSVTVTLPSGTLLAAGAHLLVGESAVSGADVTADISLGNAGSSSDAVRLSDCEDAVIDTLVYGTPNTDGWLDDGGATATSLGPKAPSASSIARVVDGVDTDASGVDFGLDTTPTPGAENDGEGGGDTDTGPVSCDYGDVKINELIPDPAGTDTGQEWVELYNPGTVALDLSGWALVSGTSSFSKRVALPSGTILDAGDLLVIGHSGVSAADIVADGLDLGNAGTTGDAILLEDCDGIVVDTVVYGANNDDAFVDDTGTVAMSLAPKPQSGKSLARLEDGADTNASAVDFGVAAFPSPGISNTAPPEDCGGTLSGLKINELMPDPIGPDADFEWLELYNAGAAALDLEGWAIQAATSDSFGNEAVFDAGTTLEPGAFLLIGAGQVSGADVVVEAFSLPNGTNGDAVRVVDCKGFPADTVAYGSTNTDLVIDDSGGVATSLASDPPEGSSLQRREDGVDTDQSGLDFALQAAPTPGASNPVIELDPCVPSTGTVKINEVLPDADGTDADAEWFELHNDAGGSVSLSGWYFTIAGKADDYGDVDVLLGQGTSIASGGFLVIGGSLVPEADLVKTFTLGNGTGGDALVLYDCEGTQVDTVIWGADNADGVTDDAGQAVGPYGNPGERQSLARVDDGVDDDIADDWFVDGTASPGATNYTAIVDDTDGTETPGGGCGGKDTSAPGGGCGGRPPDGDVGGCAVAPVPMNPLWLLVGIALCRRRR